MAWVMTRHGARGTRYTGAYRDPDGGDPLGRVVLHAARGAACGQP